MQPTQPQKLTPIRKEYIWGTEDWMLSWFNEGLEDVPLLIKIIQAREALSVQVHPAMHLPRKRNIKVARLRCGMCWTASRAHICIMA